MASGNGRIWSLPLVVVGALALATPAAVAQMGGGQQPQSAPSAQPPQGQQAPQDQQAPQGQSGQHISDDQLKAFALAATQVRDINTSYQPQIAEAEAEKDAGKSANLRKEAQEKMMKAVEEHGLDVDTYNKIYVVARADPAVWGKIVEYMKQPQ